MSLEVGGVYPQVHVFGGGRNHYPLNGLRKMDDVRSAFHAQLAAVMDSLLAAAVCQIAKIFESSLCEQQVELAHKTREISILLGRLDQEERKGGVADDTLDNSTETGMHAEPDDGNNISISELKTEFIRHDDQDLINHTSPLRDVPHPPLGSFMVEVPEGSPVIGDQRKTDPLTGSHIKAESSPWYQERPLADHQPQQDQASPPFRCSPPPDPSLAQHRDWSSVLDGTRSEACGLDGLPTNSFSCSSPAGARTTTDTTKLRSNTNAKEDGPFVFHENQKSAHQGQQDQSQVLSQWGRSGDRIDPINSSRQSNSQLLKAVQAHPLNFTAASTGGSGRPYNCPYCTKSFTYPSHHRRHLLRHMGVRLHPCQLCDKSFLTPSELTIHTRTHTGERPFGCIQCGKRFARSGNLKAHQRDVHMRKRPFACAKCGKRFAHRGDLRVHNDRMHQGDLFYTAEQQEPHIGPNPT
nr:B-cell CLL/lymphoma 6 member B protein-like [Nerophis lumbriciformis]